MIEAAPFGEVYNCGSDLPISIHGVVYLCAMACNVEFYSFVDIAGEREGQDGRYFLDSSKLKALGWKPEVPLLGGSADVVQWIRDNPEVLDMPTTWEVRS